MSLQSKVFGLEPIIYHCFSLFSAPLRPCPVCSDLSIQTGPLREYGFEGAVLFRAGHPNVRVGLNSYSKAERV